MSGRRAKALRKIARSIADNPRKIEIGYKLLKRQYVHGAKQPRK